MKLSAFLGTVGAFSDDFWARYPHPLLLQDGTDAGREVFSLRARDGVLTIGRGPPCELVIADPTISSRHARLHAPANPAAPWQVEDLGSTNGTVVGEQILEAGVRHDLVDGARLRVGTHLAFTFLAPTSFRALLVGKDRSPVAADGPTVVSVAVPAGLAPEEEQQEAPPASPPPKQHQLFLYCDPLEPRALPDGAIVVLGRKEGACDWVLPDTELSKRHVEVRRVGRRVLVRDLGSTNGSFLEGKRLGAEAVELFPRRYLKVGPFQLWVDGPHLSTSERALLPAERTGRIDGQALRQLLAEIEAQARAGSLEVEGPGIRGRVSFADGRPCQATIEGGEEGTGAIRRLLALRELQYTLRDDHRTVPPTRRISKTFSDLLRPAS